MDILYIGFDIEGVGGIATYSRYQIRALRALGHRVFVLSIDKTERRIAPGTADHHIAFSGRFATVLDSLRFLARLDRAVDAVFINHVYLAGLGLLRRALRGSPYIVNAYNIDVLTRLPALREIAFARADLVIADCRYTIDRLPQFHARMPPTGLLYDPVDTSFFRPIPQAEARQELARRFGFTDLDGRFIAVTIAAMLEPPNKGHRQMIDALAQLAAPRLLYLVVGEGPDRPVIAAYAEQHGVARQVRFTGLVDQDALPFLYSAADVAVLVARGGPGQGEAVPLGLIEASACGVPFICGNEDGSVEAISAELPNGFAIDPNRPAALAEKIRRLADDAGLGAEMGRNGKRVVDEVFTFETFTQQQGRLLDQCITRSKAVAPADSAAKGAEARRQASSGRP